MSPSPADRRVIGNIHYSTAGSEAQTSRVDNPLTNLPANTVDPELLACFRELFMDRIWMQPASSASKSGPSQGGPKSGGGGGYNANYPALGGNLVK